MSKLILDSAALAPVLQAQQEAFNLDRYPEYQQRIDDLNKLKAMLLGHQDAFVQALSEDFGHRSCDDSLIGDILTTVSSISYHIKHLKKWMKPKRKHIGIMFQPASGSVLYQPIGVIGIIVPWNYPLFLALGPLATAIAAGNRAMMKMSEFTPHTNELLAKLMADNFAPEQIAVISGEADVAAAFSKLPFDHLFFTGSTAIGKRVLQAAAENMVPVTLELGGKSPAIIDKDMPIKKAVERFLFGKTFNAGQTCVAPDYIFCPSHKVDELISETQALFSSMFPEVENNDDYTCIVNQQHYDRVQALLADAKEKGATLIPLGATSETSSLRKIPLTLITGVRDDMLVMQEEIFGPLLPIKSYEALDEVITYINDRPRPLSLYVYSFDEKVQDLLMRQTIAGGVCINDASFHVANEDLPFGGVGASGMGNYHGEEGFIRFSHAKAILKRGRVSFAPFLFPPYGKLTHKLVYKLFIR